jgi:hypothetical protein
MKIRKNGKESVPFEVGNGREVVVVPFGIGNGRREVVM